MKTSPIKEVRNLYNASADSYNDIMDVEIELPVYSDTLFRLSARISDTPGLVIDTSCGPGHMLDLYHRRYDPERALVGIDVSPRMTELATRKLGTGAKIFTADMRELDMVSSSSAAAVLSFFALHHLDSDNILLAFKEWNRILCINGQLVIAAWEGKGSVDYGDDSDVVALRYSPEEITSWAIANGFAVTRCTVEPVEDFPMQAIYLEAGKCELI